MNLFALVLYGLINGAMVVVHLLNKTRVYEFPFWAGLFALGWLYPQMIGGYRNIDTYPDHAYSNAVLFASLCTLALWGGHIWGIRRNSTKRSWLEDDFEISKLVVVGSILCVTGFFFQWKLSSLPEEMLAKSQWSGAAVKYLFLASIFQFGFLTLWLIYLSRGNLFVPNLLAFIIPSMLLLLNAAVLNGRRAGMMNLVAYVLVSLWFVRRWMMPRWILMVGLVLGLTLVNAIGTYRNMIQNNEIPLIQRIELASKASISEASSRDEGGAKAEFDNYVYCRQVYAEEGRYDWGLMHWNKLVFNYVPGQLVGRGIKDSLMLPVDDYGMDLANKRYGHHYFTGTTATGYKDAFLSYGWFGFLKFGVIGWMMGVLYRHAMMNNFLGQLLYAYLLTAAMHAISHGTHAILVSKWVYFFALGYPALRWARVQNGEDLE